MPRFLHKTLLGTAPSPPEQQPEPYPVFALFLKRLNSRMESASACRALNGMVFLLLPSPSTFSKVMLGAASLVLPDFWVRFRRWRGMFCHQQSIAAWRRAKHRYTRTPWRRPNSIPRIVGNPETEFEEVGRISNGKSACRK
jgi:hypothetical protein